MERGLRQGDPLSPLLFLLVAEAFQMTILEAYGKRVYNGVSLGSSGTNVSLLQYADDALFFGEWSRLNAYNFIRILKCFEKTSGLKVNIAKSHLYDVGVSRLDVKVVVSSLGCDHGSLLFIYLGLPLGSKMNRVIGWNEVVNHVRVRLSSWKAKALSIGDPGHGIAWVKWKSILLDKELGGLGACCLHFKNLGLLGKWKWHFLNEGNALWRMVIREFYGPGGGFGDTSGGGSAIGGVWITDRWHCLDGIWCGKWAWRPPPRGRSLDKLASLAIRIGNLTLFLDGVYKWSWAGEASGIFNVKTVSKKIENLSLNNFALGKNLCWNSFIPRKVNICMWRASLDRLHSRVNLFMRGVGLSSTSYPFCELVVEDIDHWCNIN
ncbi:RNA-directed DNA polymerase, eukaryota, reverse transcriptase zinc-binding domain protein [Tanacetum coccineum]|uniref:RNA-directed DNA polymerase, eukaryota, reverse transcriptase zinc-binding domain protein n=1 Tax=Tanacetum coccineum TaxID=301880 RepID=A0ABQ5J2M5_9ASTR